MHFCTLNKYAMKITNDILKDYFYDKLVEQFNSKIHVGMQGHIPLLTTKLEDCGAIGAAMLPMSRLK